MSYLVLARKWRPTIFENVLGQSHVTTTIRNAILSGRIAHAYLFAGPRGVGKTTVARILAKALNCVNGPTISPCNECQSCKEIAGNISVDVIEIDGASNTSVDNVREIRENIKYLPSHGKYRVYIIDEVHMLSNQAFNALLKTLEEPPSHAVFIFATTESHKIPATILSRCQRFDFKRISLREIHKHLKFVAETEEIKITDAGIYLIAKEVDGSLRDAHSLLDQVIAFAGKDIKETDVVSALGIMDRALLFQIAGALIDRNGAECLSVIEKVYEFGYDLKKFCQDLLEYIRNLVIVKAVDVPEDVLDIPDSEMDDIKILAGKTSLQDMKMMFSMLSRGYEDISRTPSPRFTLEMAILNMAHIESIKSIDTILSEIELLKMSGKAGVVPENRKFENVPETAGKQIETTAAMPVSVEKWPMFVDFTRKKKPPLASHLELAKLVSINGNIVSLVIKDGPYFAYLLENRKTIEQLCGNFFGVDMTLDIKAGEDNVMPSTAQEYDSIIKEAVRTFGGRIVQDRVSRPA